MKILSLSDVLGADEKTVVTVGNFDGVHSGHRKLIDETIARAAGLGCRSAVVTFDPHTRTIVSNEDGNLLTSFDEKAHLMENAGIDYLLRVPFTAAMRDRPPDSFVAEVLSGVLHAAGWVMGSGHTIGRDRAGNADFLRAMEGKYHFKTFVADLLVQGGDTVSSTLIRNGIAQGHIAEAAVMLGHPYLVSADRTMGLKIGRKLGFPTLNFTKPIVQKVIPPPGVYVAELEYHGTFEQGLLYFGDCPTLGEHREIHFEFFSFDRGKEEIETGHRAWLWIHDFVRADREFGTAGELVEQIRNDIEATRTFFTKEKMQWR
ncbi:MAG: hypothetical protein MUF22_04520 [Chitinispirillaceae bacterium]|jgi:riboflavin kinase/FMN adenylyltransferase|nr:hypothetical protein [Chitinispirillaceae bacterium]